MLRKLIRSLLSEKFLGRLDYYLSPELRNTWGGPFNGQQYRVKIFLDLVNAIKVDFIVETGTFKGATTQFMANVVDLPVYSVESVRRNFGFATQRLHKFKNVNLICDDCRSFLKRLSHQPGLKGKTVLFYLDAHWNQDLPLAQELVLILAHWDRAIIAVDDFQVEDDAGYGFDDYGDGNALTLDYLQRHKISGFEVFYPAIHSDSESGAKRGLVVLVRHSELIEQLKMLPTLRIYNRDTSEHYNLIIKH